MIGRRDFVPGLTAAVIAALVPGRAGAEPPPETTKIRLVRELSICLASVYVGEELLKAEGFTRGASGPIQAEEASIERPTSKLAPA